MVCRVPSIVSSVDHRIQRSVLFIVGGLQWARGTRRRGFLVPSSLLPTTQWLSSEYMTSSSFHHCFVKHSILSKEFMTLTQHQRPPIFPRLSKCWIHSLPPSTWHPHITHGPRHLIFLRVLPSLSQDTLGFLLFHFPLRCPWNSFKCLSLNSYLLSVILSGNRVCFSDHIYSPGVTTDFISNKISIFPSHTDLWDLSRAPGPQSTFLLHAFFYVSPRLLKIMVSPTLFLSLPYLSTE